MEIDEKIRDFANLIEEHTTKRFTREGYTLERHYDSAIKTTIKPGKKYTKVDVGASGKYMIDHATEEIFGIKAYGVIHRGHKYGTLDTTKEWFWGEYKAIKLA